MKQQCAKRVAVAITDHFAVILRLTLDISCTSRGKGFWRMNASYLSEPTFQQTIKENWVKWQVHTQNYPNRVMWWGHYVKRLLKKFFSREGAECLRDRMEMEHFYYTAIYDVIRVTNHPAAKAITLKNLKATIVRLHKHTTPWNVFRHQGKRQDSG
jgi:hypothetical protein